MTLNIGLNEDERASARRRRMRKDRTYGDAADDELTSERAAS